MTEAGRPTLGVRRIATSLLVVLVVAAMVLVGGAGASADTTTSDDSETPTTDDGAETGEGDQPAEELTEEEAEAQAAQDALLLEGAEVYSQICSSCHQPGGVGVSGQYPPLIDNPSVDDPAYVRDVIVNGLDGPITVAGETYDGVMPSFSTLGDPDIDAVIAYVQSGFAAPEGEAAVAPTGPVAGSELPGLASAGAYVAYLLAVLVGAMVLYPRLASVNDRLDTPWLDAGLKTATIVVAIVFLTVVVPDWVLQRNAVASLDRVAQDAIGLAVWGGGLVACLGALWVPPPGVEDLMVGGSTGEDEPSALGRLQFYDHNIPCLAACPVHTNAGMYVAAIADGDDELAYLTARLPNPFASVCGRVCAAPCEDACRRGEIDRPIAIRALKRFVTEQFGPGERAPRSGVGGGTADRGAARVDRCDRRRAGGDGLRPRPAPSRLSGHRLRSHRPARRSDVARHPRVPPGPRRAERPTSTRSSTSASRCS